MTTPENRAALRIADDEATPPLQEGTDMSNGLIERLRNNVCLFSKLDWQDHVALANEAADRIAALTAENERLKAELNRRIDAAIGEPGNG